MSATAEVIARGVLWWADHRPFSKEAKERRKGRRDARRIARKLGVPARELLSKAEVREVDSIKGGLKSKLVWLGLAQVAYGLFQLWATGDLSPETAGPVVSGALTVALRAITNTSLADKAK